MSDLDDPHSILTNAHARRGSATVPTIGDAIEALDGFCRDLGQVLLRIVDLGAELASKDHIRVDNIQEVRHHLYHSQLPTERDMRADCAHG